MIEIKELKFRLGELAERAMKLQDRLSESQGEPLNASDSKVCRLALMEGLDDLAHTLKMEFYLGNVGSFDDAMERIQDYGEFMINLNQRGK